MKFFFPTCCFIFLCLPGNAQKLSEEEHRFFQDLFDSSEFYLLKNPERSLQFSARILDFVPKEGNEKLYTQALLNAANSEKMISGRKEALNYASQAIAISLQQQDPELIIRSYFMKASVFGEYDEQDSALIYYQEVIDHHFPGFDPYYISSAYTNVGSVYSGLGNLPKAEEYLLKGYQQAIGDAHAKLFAMAALISFYVSHHNPRYLPYLDTMAMTDFYKKASPGSLMAHFDSFLLLDEATDAEKEKTLREVYQYGLLHSSLVNQVGYGMRLYEHLDKIHKDDEAHSLLLSLYEKAVASQNGVHMSAVMRALYENSKSRGDLNDALKYLELQNELKDSLLSEENMNRISELNIRFETAQKDYEIKQQKARLDLERRNRNIFILLALLLTALATMIFFYLRNRVRSAQRIAEQEKVIHLHENEQLKKEKEVSELTVALETQEKERNRIARDLHDGLGSMMSGISSQIEYLRAQPAILQAGHEQLVQLKDMVKEATSELRRTSYELMPATLLRQGLDPAIRDLCLNLLVKNGIETNLEINADLNTLNPEQQLTLYRIVQELLNNIVKHAEARQVFIQFTRFDNEISLVVEDDGKGFDVATGNADGGLGLGSLNSRVNLLNGFLDIASMPGEGTTVTVNFNVNR